MLKVDEPPPELDWIKLREELGGEGAPESPKAKMLRKIGENPFVPIGGFVLDSSILVDQQAYLLF